MNIIKKSMQSICLNNKTICSIMSKDLLVSSITIPNIQRIRDDCKVNDIIDYQKKQLSSKGDFNFHGVINIHYCKETDDCYLVDGQHRFEAIKILGEQYNIKLLIEVTIVDTLKELTDNYTTINHNTPLPEFPESIDKNIPEQAAILFKSKYPNIWSKSSIARRPRIYFNFFQEALGFLTEKLAIKKTDDLVELVESKNIEISKWYLDNYPDSKTINNQMIENCKKYGFYLGLFKHESDDSGGYSWVKDIVYTNTGERIANKKKKKNGKTNIPKVLKKTIWNEYVGKIHRHAICICCCDNMIENDDCHYGHIISEADGGETNINNLLPICSKCNGSMGKRNMGDFIKQYYPDNYNYFLNKKYTYTKNHNNQSLLSLGINTMRNN